MTQAADQSPWTPEGHRSKPPINPKRVTAALAVVATAIGAVAAGTSLFDWLDARVDAPAPPPLAEVDARVVAVTLRSPHEPLADYLRETNRSREGYTRYELDEEGLVFNVRLSAKGRVGELLGLRWSVVSVPNGRTLPGRIYNLRPAWFKPSGRSQARTWPLWVPYPPRRGEFRLRAALIDAARQPLDQDESKPFAVTGAPGP